LGVLGGDQIPVRSGVEAVAWGRAARISGALRVSNPSDMTSIAKAIRTGRKVWRIIRKTLCFKIRAMLEK
jgi:hypothetical protein